MTQEATSQSVRGRFDGEPVTYWGGTIRPFMRDGRYYFAYGPGTGAQEGQTVEIVRTVGSRRYQQYLAKLPTGARNGGRNGGRSGGGNRSASGASGSSAADGGGTYYRLQMLWHIEDERWVHMNGVFLGHDDNGFHSQLTVWNNGCIMCHNTGPVPGVVNWDDIAQGIVSGRQAMGQAPEFVYESEVAELGIACGSCHGPGSVHAKRNRNPFRRYLLHFTGQADPTIINPARLDKEQRVDVCGQCHGQRLPKSQSMVVAWTKEGPSFRAGDTLDDHVDVVYRESKPLYASHADDIFLGRFWNDGTPRLTAYELQGLRQSACYQRGELTCTDCHTMHGGDVYGQLPPEHRTAIACADCHADIVADVPAHTRHQSGSSGSDCYSCHMPKMVYGIMEIHRSHRIEIPDPTRDAAASRPNACTSCHMDKSLAWASEHAATWWGQEYAAAEGARIDGNGDGAEEDGGVDEDSVAELGAGAAHMVMDLLGGDPVGRAVAARLLGRRDSPLGIEVRGWLVPHLLTAMQRDNYPAVRRFAQKSVSALAEELATMAGMDVGGFLRTVEDFDFIADAAVRAKVMAQLWADWRHIAAALAKPDTAVRNSFLLDDTGMPDPAAVEALIAQAAARSKEVNIGE